MLRTAAVLALTLTVARPVRGQQPAPPHVIQWYEAGGAVAGVLALMLVDAPVQRWAQRSRSPTSDDIAAVVRRMGQPEVFVTTSLGLLGAGWLSGNDKLAKAGGRAAASLALAAVVELSLKVIIGRARPDAGLGATHYEPFGGDESLPSGHTTVAFALATSLAGEVRPTWARIGLYGLATATGWSRMNDNRHWLSDVAGGALIGITSAKLIAGKWQAFSIRPPSGLASADRTTVVSVNIPF